MPFYLRPRSINLAVTHLGNQEAVKKQTEILDDIGKNAGYNLDNPDTPLQAFQRNFDGSYTVTLKSTNEKEKLENMLQSATFSTKFRYKATTADIVSGRLTITECPVEYPIPKLFQLLQQFIDIASIKDGYYRNVPGIKNGVKHVIYRKEIKSIPTTLRLPEGIQITIKKDNIEIPNHHPEDHAEMHKEKQKSPWNGHEQIKEKLNEIKPELTLPQSKPETNQTPPTAKNTVETSIIDLETPTHTQSEDEETDKAESLDLYMEDSDTDTLTELTEEDTNPSTKPSPNPTKDTQPSTPNKDERKNTAEVNKPTTPQWKIRQMENNHKKRKKVKAKKRL